MQFIEVIRKSSLTRDNLLYGVATFNTGVGCIQQPLLKGQPPTILIRLEGNLNVALWSSGITERDERFSDGQYSSGDLYSSFVNTW